MPSLMIGTKRIEINQSPLIIGRSESCTVVLPGGQVQGEHARLEERGGAIWIVSLSRLALIYVNGVKTRRQALRHQDHLKIGDHTLQYLLYQPVRVDPQKRDERLRAYQRLYQFSYRVAEQRQPAELFEVILEELVELTGADQGVLVSLEGHEYSIRATVDHLSGHEIVYDTETTDDEAFEDADVKISESVIRQVLQTREPLLNNDILNDQGFEPSHSMLEMGLCSVMCAPLIMQGEVLGAIYVGSHKPQCFFQSHDLKALCLFSSQAAMLLKRAQTTDHLSEDNQRLRQELERDQFGDMVGSSPSMLEVYQRVDRFSQADINLLVTGETGTGKELIAREVHRRSKRSGGPFVSINCGALPEGLVESELFGHRAGAFTGAYHDKDGCFTAANGGTLFLDEIGELPLTLQVKLLRVIEERAVIPLGTNQPVSLNVRLICATNTDLKRALAEGHFRTDLYYRINVAQVHLPPLRERGADVISLAKFLIKRYSERYNYPLKSLSSEALLGLTRYTWPGNIRELDNRICQGLILSDGDELTLQDLNIQPVMLESPILSLREAQEHFSRDYVSHVLRLNGGNRSQTARDLGVDPRTIFRYLERERKSIDGN